MNRWRLLAVDDERINLEIIGEYLDDPRIVLDRVANAAEAVGADGEYRGCGNDVLAAVTLQG